MANVYGTNTARHVLALRQARVADNAGTRIVFLPDSATRREIASMLPWTVRNSAFPDCQ